MLWCAKCNHGGASGGLGVECARKRHYIWAEKRNFVVLRAASLPTCAAALAPVGFVSPPGLSEPLTDQQITDVLSVDSDAAELPIISVAIPAFTNQRDLTLTYDL